MGEFAVKSCNLSLTYGEISAFHYELLKDCSFSPWINNFNFINKSKARLLATATEKFNCSKLDAIPLLRKYQHHVTYMNPNIARRQILLVIALYSNARKINIIGYHWKFGRAYLEPMLLAVLGLVVSTSI